MELREYLYDNRNQLGIKDDVSYGDLLKLEENVKKWYGDKEENPIEMGEDISKLVDISMKMRILLEECRTNRLPLALSSSIDDLLKEIDYL